MSGSIEVVINTNRVEAQISATGIDVSLSSGTLSEVIIGDTGPQGLPGIDGSDGADGAPGPKGGGTNPNLLVNGDFLVNQRLFTGGALAAGVFGYDRWKADTNGANCTLSGSTLTLASGALVQTIETSLWGYDSLASTEFTVSVDSPSADLTVTVGGTSGTIPAGSGRQSVTLTSGSSATGNLTFRIAKATSGSVTFRQVKLEVGAAATGWQSRADELALCTRYYQRFFWSVEGYASGGFQRVRTTAIFLPMRTTPTVTRILTGFNSNVRQSDPDHYVAFSPQSPNTAYVDIESNSTGRVQAIGFIDEASTEL